MTTRWWCCVMVSALALVGVSRPGYGVAAITSTGSWTNVVNAADLVAGAGSALNSTYQSAANQATLAVSGMPSKWTTWRVDVRRTDTAWHADLALWVKRTSAGSGTGASPTGGTAYQAVSTSNATFFSGAGNRTGLALQFQLTGMSLQVLPRAYSTTITMTIVAI